MFSRTLADDAPSPSVDVAVTLPEVAQEEEDQEEEDLQEEPPYLQVRL